MKVIFEREKCIGCGTCAAVCSKYWELAEDGKSQLLGSKPDPKSGNYELEINPVRDYKSKEKVQGKQISNGVKEIGCIQEAADSCPVQCIRIEK